jgi:uncharacterized protein DUF4440
VRKSFIGAFAALALACSAFGQQPPAGAAQDSGTKQPAPSSPEASKSAASTPSISAASDKKLADMLESKIRASWEAFKNKDQKAYAEFLSDDFMAVEEDGLGERTKSRVLREVGESVIYDYKLQLFRTDQILPGAALVTYENVIQFPPRIGSRFDKIFVSEIWVKRNGQWKSWRYQATKVK